MSYREWIAAAVARSGIHDLEWRVLASPELCAEIRAECPDLAFRLGEAQDVPPGMLYIASIDQLRQWAEEDWPVVINGVVVNG